MLQIQSNKCNQESELFADAVEDWTPRELRGVARLLFAPVQRDCDVTARCATLLSNEERERANRFISSDGRTLFIQRRAFQRYCGAIALHSIGPLHKIEFEHTKKGRPFVPNFQNVWFSFSSCRLGILGAWAYNRKIGVDIEDYSRKLEFKELSERFFSKGEAEALEGDEGTALRNFVRLWCLKEAALKSIGEGLPFGLERFQFQIAPSLRITRAPEEYGGSAAFRPDVIERSNVCATLILRR